LKRALITGISGQDGSYLAELLVAKGYRVFGTVRREGLHPNLRHVQDKIALTTIDLLNAEDVKAYVESVAPDEIYHLAAKTFVPSSFDAPEDVIAFSVRSVGNLLEAVTSLTPPNPPVGPGGKIKLFYASSSEVFGSASESPQAETTPFSPRSPYGEGKALATKLVREAREVHGAFACSGILFNHESPRRGANFVTRKITRGAAAILRGEQETLELGDLDARRDWGYAAEYAEAMWRMLQADAPDDFVIATGETHSVREFCELAFGELGLDYAKFVRVNPAFVRAPEAVQLVGDASKAKRVLNWQAQTPFPDLVKMMVRADSESLRDSSLRSE